jgi:hypothetical protein
LGKKELEEVLDTLKKSDRKDRFNAFQKYFPSIILSTEKEAMDWVESQLSARWAINRGQTANMLHNIGRTSPPTYWKMVAEFVDHENLRIRNEAIVALEQLGEPKSLKALMKQRSVEKEDSARANLIRAIASVGKGNRKAETLVLKASEKDKSELIRINALIGLVYVENREKVNQVLVNALNETNPGVRAAAAYTVAVRRETEMAPAIKVALDIEEDPGCKRYLEAAQAILNGGSLEEVQGVLKDYALDEIERDR